MGHYAVVQHASGVHRFALSSGVLYSMTPSETCHARLALQALAAQSEVLTTSADTAWQWHGDVAVVHSPESAYLPL